MGWDARNQWTYAQISLLWELARNKTPLHELIARAGKTYEEICVKAAELGISLSDAQAPSTEERAHARTETA